MGALLGFMAVAVLGAGTFLLVLFGGRRKALLPRERRELAEACRAAGIAPDEIEELVRTENDAELVRRHRLAHRALRGRTGPFR
jgi:hypothetical protein